MPRKRCRHGQQRCKECTPQCFCKEHGNRKDQCKECGTGYCGHGIQKSLCVDCGGGGICEAHQIVRSLCIECGGGGLCETHHIKRSNCIECGGCIHGSLVSLCAEGCGGASLCEPHKRRKDQCVECKGSAVCKHEVRRVTCVQCDGNSLCEHKSVKHRCVPCHGSGICEHKKRRNTCSICDPHGHFVHIMRTRLYQGLEATGNEKNKHSIEYLGGHTFDEIRLYLDSITPAIEGIKMHIDHICPLASFPNFATSELEQQMACHPTNMRRCTAEENEMKGAHLWFTSLWYGDKTGWVHILKAEFVEQYRRFHPKTANDDDGIFGNMMCYTVPVSKM